MTTIQAPAEHKTVRADNLGGLSEIARDVKLSRQRVGQYADEPDFPAPVARLSMGPVWDMAEVLPWIAERRKRRSPTAAG